MKMAFSKCIFLSVKQQKIIWSMYNNGGQINYKTQNIYKTERSFNVAMGILFEANAVNMIMNDEYYNEFVLTKAGRFLCKSNIIPLKVRS